MEVTSTPGKVIFIGMPTIGSTDEHSASTGVMKEMVYRTVARLHEMYPQYTFVVPMIQDYALLKYLDKEPTWDVWGNHCRRLIERSDEVWIILMNGWLDPSYTKSSVNTSSGVYGEITHALKHGVPVDFVNPVSE